MIRVMIVEDDPMVRDINSRFLKKLDEFILVKAVPNLSEAKDFIIQNKLDLILLDIYLPKENGIDLLKWLRKEEINVDVILITADKTCNMVQEAFRYGADDYLIKPFTFERFREALINYKDRYHNFNDLDIIEQNMLDKCILKSVVPEDENELVKGINKYTYDVIWQEVEKLEGKYTSAEEISEKSGIARVTVRRYLECMKKEGKVKKVIEYGKVGRPQHKYKMIII